MKCLPGLYAKLVDFLLQDKCGDSSAVANKPDLSVVPCNVHQPTQNMPYTPHDLIILHVKVRKGACAKVEALYIRSKGPSLVSRKVQVGYLPEKEACVYLFDVIHLGEILCLCEWSDTGLEGDKMSLRGMLRWTRNNPDSGRRHT